MDDTRKKYTSYHEFELEAMREAKDPRAAPVKFGGFEWPEGSGTGEQTPGCTITELSQRPKCPLRIVFAPLDLPNANTSEDLLALYRFYNVPGPFVSERLHHVAHSFGSAKERQGFTYSWFHFLCKNVPVTEVNGVKYIVNQNRRDAKDLSQADFTWVRSAYCLKAKPPTQSAEWSEVTLIVFGGGQALWEKFKALSTNKTCHEILEDPSSLFEVVFEFLYTQMDEIAWNVAHVYSQEEEKILKSADRPGSAADSLDFVGLHMLFKHQIYLLEAVEAVTATLDALQAHHEEITNCRTNPTPAASETQAALRHRRTLFKSTNLRLKSLEKRTQNMINLSFNLVTQADSRVMKADSSSMKTIAVMTLIFLPCTAVATIFSTPFFYLGEASNANQLIMSGYFWLIWAFAVPLTGLVMIAWYLYQRRIQTRIIGGPQPMFSREDVWRWRRLCC